MGSGHSVSQKEAYMTERFKKGGIPQAIVYEPSKKLETLKISRRGIFYPFESDVEKLKRILCAMRKQQSVC